MASDSYIIEPLGDLRVAHPGRVRLENPSDDSSFHRPVGIMGHGSFGANEGMCDAGSLQRADRKINREADYGLELERDRSGDLPHEPAGRGIEGTVRQQGA